MYNTMIIAFYSNYVNYMQPKTVVTYERNVIMS